MNPRSANILLYKFKDQKVDSESPCRICIGRTAGQFAPEICWRIPNRRCCSYSHGGLYEGLYEGSCTRNFHFDNRIHVPVLTTTECRICPDKICKITTDLICPRTNIFHLVLTYIQNIKRVGIENIEEL